MNDENILDLLAKVRDLPFSRRQRVLRALDEDLRTIEGDNCKIAWPDALLFLTPEHIVRALSQEQK